VTVLEQELQQIQDGFFAVLALSSLAVAIAMTGLLLALVNPSCCSCRWSRFPRSSPAGGPS
jgi:hypothetical protein